MKILEENNYQAYLVGGGVRDSFLNKEPKDFDVATSATPQQVKQLFDKVIPTGEKHGTVTVLIRNNSVEVTTLRKDGIYKDFRHPEEVFFTDNLKEDLARRDFTINALAIDLNDKIYDYFGGLNDLKRGAIKAVGDPNDRFKEDPLRMMRAIRFACQLDFYVNISTLTSISTNSELINRISAERIKDELCKMLLSNYPEFGIRALLDTGLLKYTISELCECDNFDQHNIHHDKNVFDHIMEVLSNTPRILNIRLAALLHDIAKPKTFTLDENGNGHFYGHHIDGADIAEEILRRLKFDNKTIETVRTLVFEHMSRYDFLRVASIKKFINRVGIGNLNDLFELQIADIKGSAPPHDFSGVINLRQKVEDILTKEEPLTVKDLAINGYDLMELGYEPSKKMGDILKYLLEEVLINPNINTKDSLKDIIANM
jgi:tRNA nucleotidyltransferase (CCA-adding enzyme)